MEKDHSKDQHSSKHSPNSSPVTENHGVSLAPPAIQLQASEPRRQRKKGLPIDVLESVESLSGYQMDDVHVEYNSSKPAQLNAHAYAQGNQIHIGPGQEKHLAHEAWHVAQQKQGRVSSGPQMKNKVSVNSDEALEKEADAMASKIKQDNSGHHFTQAKPFSVSHSNRSPIQKKVRTAYGRTKVNEAEYLPGGSKEKAGSKYKVSSLISDSVKRTFKDESELLKYANGATDYIGDVKTAAKGTYWYRLPKNKLKVLGESHQNPDGNVPDIINAFGTSRFKYEPFNELEGIGAIKTTGTSTQDRLDDVDSKSDVAGNVDKKKFNPALENIVVKAMTGCGLVRNGFIANDPAKMKGKTKKDWSGRKTADGYSYGDRTALYFTMAIHVAKDVSGGSFGDETMLDRAVVTSARSLKAFYKKYQLVLDDYMARKDKDELIGIYELSEANGFSDLTILEDFSKLFHVYGARYLQELGDESGNKKLTAEAVKLEANIDASKGGSIVDVLTPYSPAREEVIWNKVLEAKKGGFLIAGMGDRHRTNLEKRIVDAGISHEETTDSLKKQKKQINGKWKK